MKKVFFEFLSTSTAHAFLRIGTARTKFQQIIWIFLIIVAIGMFSISFKRLINQYSLEETTLTITENKIPFSYPDIYMCNHRPLSSSAMLENKLSTEQEYVLNLINQSILNAENLWTTINNSILYSAYGYTGDEYSPTFFGSLPVVNGTSVHHLLYFHCFYFNMSDYEEYKNSNEELEFVFYADAFHDKISLPTFFDNINYPHFNEAGFGLYGYRMFFTEPNTYPHEDSQSIYVNPGEATFIQFSMTKTTLLNTKAKPCQSNSGTIKYVNRLKEDHFIEYKRTENDCRWQAVWKQLQSMKNCSCIPHWMPIEFDIFKNYPTCGDPRSIEKKNYNFSKRRNWFKNQTKCEKIARKLFQSSEFHECKKETPCTKMEYSVSSHAIKMDALNIMKRVNIPPRPREDLNDSSYPLYRGFKFFFYELIFLQVDRNSIIEKNMVKITLAPRKLFSSTKEERLLQSPITLMAEIGGLCGLYLGASLLTLFEPLNLIYDLFWIAVSKKENKELPVPNKG